MGSAVQGLNPATLSSPRNPGFPSYYHGKATCPRPQLRFPGHVTTVPLAPTASPTHLARERREEKAFNFRNHYCCLSAPTGFSRYEDTGRGESGPCCTHSQGGGADTGYQGSHWGWQPPPGPLPNLHPPIWSQPLVPGVCLHGNIPIAGVRNLGNQVLPPHHLGGWNPWLHPLPTPTSALMAASHWGCWAQRGHSVTEPTSMSLLNAIRQQCQCAHSSWLLRAYYMLLGSPSLYGAG